MTTPELVKFAVGAGDAPLPGSLALAFLGDTVYDLYVRAALVQRGGRMKALAGSAAKAVCAHGQAEAFDLLEPLMTPEERDVARRARNAHQHPAKHANPAEYHRATALEAVLGFLALTGQTERIEALMRTLGDRLSPP